jgi:hypothetical protein
MPKGIQNSVAARLQIWLDLAAVLPASEELPPPWETSSELMEQVFQQSADPEPPWPGSDLWCSGKFPELFGPFPADSPLHDRKTASRAFYRFFFDIRSALDWLVEAVDVAPLDSRLTPQGLWISSKEKVVFASSGLQTVGVDKGKVHFEDNREWIRFREALEGVEVKRLRRCPVCQRIYYAVRDNKGACDLHLDVARVRRHRDPESRRKYEKTRKINRLVKTRLPLSQARMLVESRSKNGGNNE